MQQFTVPQFIDVEDKIIGPITTRQFIIMLVDFALTGVFYKIFDFSLFITVTLFLFAVFGTIAFAKINGRPFHYFLLNLIQTSKRPRLRIWINKVSQVSEEIVISEKNVINKNIGPSLKEAATKSRLNELSLIVDTKGVYKGGEIKLAEEEIK